ncbi:hypothetical protein GCM10023317_31920 [Actinopolymorpha pittospori]
MRSGAQATAVNIPAIRAIGFRKVARQVPILHTKLFIVGHLWWLEDEEAMDEIQRFSPARVWVGSANGTASSRHSLEMGLWLDEPVLLRAATDFIVKVMRHSETIYPEQGLFVPDLAEVDYDGDAFAELAAEFRYWGGEDDEDE